MGSHQFKKIIQYTQENSVHSLAELDRLGFIPGADENEKDFRDRVACLIHNLQDFLCRLEQEKSFAFYDVVFDWNRQIPKECYHRAIEQLKNLWAVQPEWVPGFFSSQRMGMLFAGCALYSRKLNLAFLFLREIFSRKKVWLIYSREELLAHELTHIAHSALLTPEYEEFLAYQTSTSWLRRFLGGMLRSPRDTYLLLGVMLFLMIFQLVNLFLRPPMLWWSMPTPLVWGGVMVVLGFFVVRYLWRRREILQAEKQCRHVFGLPHGWPIIFRATEEEIRLLAKTPMDKIPFLIQQWADERLRWQIVMQRFPFILSSSDNQSIPKDKVTY